MISFCSEFYAASWGAMRFHGFYRYLELFEFEVSFHYNIISFCMPKSGSVDTDHINWNYRDLASVIVVYAEVDHFKSHSTRIRVNIKAVQAK